MISWKTVAGQHSDSMTCIGQCRDTMSSWNCPLLPSRTHPPMWTDPVARNLPLSSLLPTCLSTLSVSYPPEVVIISGDTRGSMTHTVIHFLFCSFLVSQPQEDGKRVPRGFPGSPPSDMPVIVAAVNEPRRVEAGCMRCSAGQWSTGQHEKNKNKMVQGFKSKKTTTTPKNNRHKAQSVKKGGEWPSGTETHRRTDLLNLFYRPSGPSQQTSSGDSETEERGQLSTHAQEFPAGYSI